MPKRRTSPPLGRAAKVARTEVRPLRQGWMPGQRRRARFSACLFMCAGAGAPGGLFLGLPRCSKKKLFFKWCVLIPMPPGHE